MREYELAKMVGAQAGDVGYLNAREMTPEEKQQAERARVLFDAVRHNYDTVMMHGTDEDRLELQRALKPIALRVIGRQPG